MARNMTEEERKEFGKKMKEARMAKKKETETQTETRKETFEDRIIKMRLMPIVLQFGKEKIITNLKELH